MCSRPMKLESSGNWSHMNNSRSWAPGATVGGRLLNLADEIFRRGCEVETPRCAAIVNGFEPAVVEVGVVNPICSDSPCAYLLTRQLAGLAKISEIECAERRSVRDKPGKLIIGEGFRARVHGARRKPAS